MLTSAAVVTEAAYHVYMVLANQAARHILQEIGILEDLDNRIYINSAIYNPSKSSDQNKNAILVEDKFVCTFDMKHPSTGLVYDMTDVDMHMDAVRHRRDKMSRYPILRDEQHNITLYDSLLPFNITLNCELHLRDYIKAHEIVDRFFLRFNRGELLAIPNLSYDFPVPQKILTTLWALASTLGVAKECFPQWVKQYSNDQIERIVSTSAKNTRYEWVVKRRVFESLIKIDYDLGEPEKQGMDNAETHMIRFTCTFHSSRPSVMYVDYPIIINNTLVPSDIVEVDTSYQKNLYEYLEHPNRFLDPVYQFEKFLTYQPVRNPWYDDWKIDQYNSQHAHFNTLPIFIGAFTLDIPECETCPCGEECAHLPTQHECHCWRNPYDEEGVMCIYHNPYDAPIKHSPDCRHCPYGKKIHDPFEPRRCYEDTGEEPCPCYCWRFSTTNINIVNDLDMYKLRPRLVNYFKDRKEKALLVESIYNITVFQDDRQINPALLQFDGTTLKVPNRLGSDHIYRLVIGYTPYRKVDSDIAWRQGYDPEDPNKVEKYCHPFCFLDALIITQRQGV